jgi:tetratricopeptide (TPR) repeat protein
VEIDDLAQGVPGMNDVSTNRPGCQPVRRRVRRLIVGILITGIIGIGACALWFYVLGPQPPEVALPTNDPGAALDIAEAHAEVKHWPFRSSKWGRFGQVLSSYGFRREAIICFSRAAELRPSNPKWPYLQGIYTAESDLDAGLALFTRSVQLGGDIQEPRLELAETLFRLGQADDAEKHFQFVLRVDPENARALFGLGCVANSRGDLAASRGHLEQTVQLAPRFRGARTLLAEVCRRLGDQQVADQHRELAASLSPDMNWPDPYMGLGGRHLRGQKHVVNRANALLKQNRARESLQLLKEMPPGSDQWYRKHLQLGRAYESLREYDLAEEAFREALRLKPDSVETFAGLANVLEKKGEFSDAAAQCRKALELKPDAVAIRFRLARCLEIEGDRAAAIESLQKYLHYKPDSPIACRELARLLADEGRDDEARRALQRALELSPDDRKLKVLRDQLEEDVPDAGDTPAVE